MKVGNDKRRLIEQPSNDPTDFFLYQQLVGDLVADLVSHKTDLMQYGLNRCRQQTTQLRNPVKQNNYSEV